jgi:2-amino-4-hydroxy-6-hydroxymethyldihydropteridine diphosphokinase
MRAPVRAIVALGSNLGDRRAHLDAAVEALAAEPELRVLAVSDWIETEPVGGPPGQGPYLNGALELETTLTARELLARLLEVEAAHGRDRRECHWAARTLDLDLILFGDEVIEEPDLVVPHPRSEERAFVLQPMAQLNPARRFPSSGRTVRECLRALWP